jgi:hypothetical protein
LTLSCGPQTADRINLLQGNSTIIRLKLCADGIPVPNLSSAIGGSFQLLGHRDNVVGIFKNWGSLLIDNPVVGIISVPLTSPETDLLDGEYDISVEVVWGPGNRLEWNFPRTLNVIRDNILFEEQP